MTQKRPKHVLISDHLLRDIRREKFPVGAPIPTETELMNQFGVSRNTVRVAIQNLKMRGIIASRQGQGSRVISSNAQGIFIETIRTIDELITFGQDTHRELLMRRIVKADSGLAEKFNCGEGRLFAEAFMLRRATDADNTALAVLTIWVDALLEPVIDDLATRSKAAVEIIRDKFGYEAKSVYQIASAGLLDDEDAARLDQAKGAPALVVERRYFTDQDEEPYMIARSVCRADAVKLTSRFLHSGSKAE